jgi:hypothetical protein
MKWVNQCELCLAEFDEDDRGLCPVCGSTCWSGVLRPDIPESDDPLAVMASIDPSLERLFAELHEVVEDLANIDEHPQLVAARQEMQLAQENLVEAAKALVDFNQAYSTAITNEDDARANETRSKT